MFLKFLYAPLLYPKMLWIVIPLLISIALTEVYFKKYPREGLGHHKSLENTIFLVFICANLAAYVADAHNSVKSTLFAIFTLLSIIIAVLDYLHMLPTRLWMKLSSKFIIGYISYVFIVLIYSDMLERFVFFEFFSMVISIAILFFMLIAAANMFFHLEPRTYPEIENYLKSIDQEIKSSKKKDSKQKKP